MISPSQGIKIDGGKPDSCYPIKFVLSMIVLFHENVLLLSTYKFIVIPIKYRNFGAFVYDSAKKQMCYHGIIGPSWYT
jgi:hypothetical protein